MLQTLAGLGKATGGDAIAPPDARSGDLPAAALLALRLRTRRRATAAEWVGRGIVFLFFDYLMLSHLMPLMLDERLRRTRLYLAIAIYLAILAIGSIPGARQAIGVLASGIILHSVAYGLLTFLLFTATQGSPTRRALVSFIAVVAMGALDETIQSSLPYRVGSLADLLVDTIAAAVTACVSRAYMPMPVLGSPANAA